MRDQYSDEYMKCLAEQQRRTASMGDLTNYYKRHIEPAPAELHRAYGYRSRQPEPPADGKRFDPPEPTDDDKVARRDREAAAQLQRDIRAAGEGGWRSQYFIGDPDRLPYAEQVAYSHWKAARDDYAHTGDLVHLDTVRDSTDFNCPPDAEPYRRQDAARANVMAREPRCERMTTKQKYSLLVAALTVFLAYVLVLGVFL